MKSKSSISGLSPPLVGRLVSSLIKVALLVRSFFLRLPPMSGMYIRSFLKSSLVPSFASITESSAMPYFGLRKSLSRVSPLGVTLLYLGDLLCLGVIHSVSITDSSYLALNFGAALEFLLR